jgi:LacI family transcriptional regulator
MEWNVPVTLKDIAERCGVSPSTVSDVLNNRGRTWASEETRRRVQAAAAELGYSPHVAARALRSGKTHAIGFLYSLDAPDFPATYDGAAEIMTSHLSEQGYHLRLHVYTAQTQLMKGLEELVRGRICDAYVLFGREEDVAIQGAFLERQRVPFVVKGRHEAQNPHWAQVDYDHEAMMHCVVDHLMARGHRRIAYIGYPPRQAFSRHLLKGFHEAFQTRLGSAPDERLIASVDGAGADACIAKWLALPPAERPTALAVGAGNTTWHEVEAALAQFQQVIGDGPGEFAVAGQAVRDLALAFGHGYYFEDISFQSIAQSAVTDLLLPLLSGQQPVQPIRRILPQLRPTHSLNLRRYCTF